MKWTPDMPGFDISKPPALNLLNSYGNDVLNAMDFVEREQRINDAARELAKTYKKEKNGDYAGCVNLVSAMLSVTGSGIGGSVGNEMVGKSDSAARSACRVVFRDDLIGDIGG